MATEDDRRERTNTRENLAKHLDGFLSKIPSVTPPEQMEFDADAAIFSPWPQWAGRSGVYFFLDSADSVLYIGKGSSGWGAGYRALINMKKEAPLPKVCRG